MRERARRPHIANSLKYLEDERAQRERLAKGGVITWRRKETTKFQKHRSIGKSQNKQRQTTGQKRESEKTKSKETKIERLCLGPPKTGTRPICVDHWQAHERRSEVATLRFQATWLGPTIRNPRVGGGGGG